MVRQGMKRSRSAVRVPTRARAVGDDQRVVVDEEGGNLRLVGLELVEGVPDGGVRVGGVLELEDGEGQAVDEEHEVGAAVVAAR